MSEHDTDATEAPQATAPKAASPKSEGFLASIDGILLSRFAALALLTSLVLGGLVFMSMRSLSGSADDAVAAAQQELGDESAAAVTVLADQVASTSSRLLLFAGAILVVGLVAAFALARSTAKRVVAPMIQLRDAARATSGSLPAFVQACEAGNGKVPSLPSVEIASGGIAGDIAASFNEMQRNAANLAVTQTFRRARDGGRFVDLGRSTEQLLNDQMRFIEAMEHDETSAANLQRLFRIDHLASRMRRNAASMLVLADRDTPRQFSRPVSIHQVIQAASSGIEHFERVSMTDLSGVAVNGAIAADLAHLLAEVLETATADARNSVTEVAGLPTADGFTVSVSGGSSSIGPAEAAAINQALSDPSIADATPTTKMTHAVMARLAKRHGITVELKPSSEGGIITQIHVPQIALARLTGEATPATPSADRSNDPAPAAPIAAPPAMPAAAAEPEPLDPALAAAVVDPEPVAAPPVADIVDRVEVPLSSEPAPSEPAPSAPPAHAEAPVAEANADQPSADVLAAAPELSELEPVQEASAAVGAEPMPKPAVAAQTPAETPAGTSAGDAEAAALAERWRVLASGQRAAIEWAMDVEGRSPSNVATALRPGPVSAATLADLDAANGEG